MTLWRLLEEVGPGILVTAEITVAAGALALVIAVPSGVARLSEYKPLRWAVGVYVEIFRGTSALVQLFWLFFALPGLGIRLAPFTVAVLGLGLNVGAYGSEIVRGAILAVPRSQTDAAIALNMTRSQRMTRVILPQALVGMLPPFGNLLVELLKSTALVSLITIPDLTFNAQQVRTLTAQSAPAYSVVLVLYFILAYPLTRAVRAVGRHAARGMDIGPQVPATS